MKKLIQSVVSLVLVGALVAPAVASAAPLSTTSDRIDLNLPRQPLAKESDTGARAAAVPGEITTTQKRVLIGVAVTGGVLVTYMLTRAFIDAAKKTETKSSSSGMPFLG